MPRTARHGIPSLPVDPHADGVIFLGGSFDPIHIWHTVVASAARRKLFPPPLKAWIVLIPAARSPLKNAAPRATDADRLSMLRLATRGMVRTAIWTDELDRAKPGRPSYTIETLRRARKLLPRVPFRLLIGADQAARFHQWRSYRAILRLAEPAVALRPPVNTEARLRRALRTSRAWSARDIERWVDRIIPAPVSDSSSTRAREVFKGRRPPDELRGLIAPPVLRYILMHRLYR